jgi:tRNA A-37 threonylcarbamoyl transferase component Bud32
MNNAITDLQKQGQINQVAPPEEPLLAAPKIVSTSFLLLVFMVIARAFLSDDGFGTNVIALAPLQLYWAFCLNRLSQITARKFKCAPPLSPGVITVLTLGSLAFFPRLDNFPMASYLLDPFFWIWAAVQIGASLSISGTLAKQLKLRYGETARVSSKAYQFVLTAGLAFLSNVYFLTFLVPAPAFLTIMLVPSVAVSEFAFLSIYNRILRGVFAADLKVIKTIKGRAAEARLLSADYPLIVHYKAFSGLQRWYKERFAGSSSKHSGRLVVASLLAPLLIIAALIFVFNTLMPATTAAITAPIVAAGASDAAIQAASGAAAAATAAQNTVFIQAFIGSIAAFFLGVFTLYVSQPTHVLLGNRGVKLLWRHRFLPGRKVEVPWSEITSISYENPSESRLFAAKKIVLHQKDKAVKLDLSAVDSVEDKESLLYAIQKWAPDVQRDSEIEQLLQPSSNHSYTELWLQALSAPPKRERLKPLLAQSHLRDGRYEIISALGVGGQGSAYLVRDRIDGATVVLKEFILPVFVNVNVRKNALEQFENEAKILRQLEHNQIVKLLDFFIEDHRAYLVLEHIDGTSLRELVEEKGALSEERVRTLAVQMCHILEYLHALNPPVVHRDFTPDNLILRADGTLKLIDFNVAQQIEESTTGTVVGKHAYLPPEQFRGETTWRSDLYALGATLQFLLTGADPEPISVSRPAEILPSISATLNDVVAKATCLAEEERYQSASEIEADLRS